MEENGHQDLNLSEHLKFNQLKFTWAWTFADLFYPLCCRYPSILGQQSGISSGRQSSPLAQVPAGPHRDGRPLRLHSAPSAPSQHTLRCPGAPPQSQLGPLPAPSLSQPRQPVPLTSPRLPAGLQTLSPAPHRPAPERCHGPPLGTVKLKLTPFPLLWENSTNTASRINTKIQNC